MTARRFGGGEPSLRRRPRLPLPRRIRVTGGLHRRGEPGGAGRRPVGGLTEIQLLRFVLETCATIGKAREALLAAKQHYMFLPRHFLVGDGGGDSFVWERSLAARSGPLSIEQAKAAHACVPREDLGFPARTLRHAIYDAADRSLESPSTRRRPGRRRRPPVAMPAIPAGLNAP